MFYAPTSILEEMKYLLEIVEIIAAASNRYKGRIYEKEGPKAEFHADRADLMNTRARVEKQTIGIVTSFMRTTFFAVENTYEAYIHISRQK